VRYWNRASIPYIFIYHKKIGGSADLILRGFFAKRPERRFIKGRQLNTFNGGKIKTETKIGGMLFFVALFLFYVKYTFDCSGLLFKNAYINSALVGLSVALPMIKIVMQRYTPARLIITAVITAAVCASCLAGGNYLFLNGFIFILAMQDVDLNKLVRFGFRYKTAMISIHVLCYIFVYFTNPSSINYVYRIGGAPRHYFFIGHANMFTAFLVWTTFEYVFLNYEKIKWYNIFIIWAINLLFYNFTDSNTGMAVLAVFTALVVLDKFAKEIFNKISAVLAKYIYLVCSLFFSWIAIIYTRLGPSQKTIWYRIDRFFTGRLWYGAYTYETYGVTFFGRILSTPDKIFWENRWMDGFMVFDNHYHGNLFGLGIIHLILVSLILLIYGKKMDAKERIIVICFSLYGAMEAYITNVFICFALLIIGKYIYLDKIKRNKIKVNG